LEQYSLNLGRKWNTAFCGSSCHYYRWTQSRVTSKSFTHLHLL